VPRITSAALVLNAENNRTENIVIKTILLRLFIFLSPKLKLKNRATLIGNPAVSLKPVAFRPYLTAGLALANFKLSNKKFL
jgi:hypothetical protein